MARRRPPAADLPSAVEAEVAKLADLTADLGQVLAASLEPLLEVKRDEPKPVPSAEWVRAYRAYELSVAALLAERRKNAALIAGVPEAPLSDEEYQAAMDELVSKRIAQMDDVQLGRIMLDKMRNQESKT